MPLLPRRQGSRCVGLHLDYMSFSFVSNEPTTFAVLRKSNPLLKTQNSLCDVDQMSDQENHMDKINT